VLVLLEFLFFCSESSYRRARELVERMRELLIFNGNYHNPARNKAEWSPRCDRWRELYRRELHNNSGGVGAEEPRDLHHQPGPSVGNNNAGNTSAWPGISTDGDEDDLKWCPCHENPAVSGQPTGCEKLDDDDDASVVDRTKSVYAVLIVFALFLAMWTARLLRRRRRRQLSVTMVDPNDHERGLGNRQGSGDLASEAVATGDGAATVRDVTGGGSGAGGGATHDDWIQEIDGKVLAPKPQKFFEVVNPAGEVLLGYYIKVAGVHAPTPDSTVHLDREARGSGSGRCVWFGQDGDGSSGKESALAAAVAASGIMNTGGGRSSLELSTGRSSFERGSSMRGSFERGSSMRGRRREGEEGGAGAVVNAGTGGGRTLVYALEDGDGPGAANGEERVEAHGTNSMHSSLFAFGDPFAGGDGDVEARDGAAVCVNSRGGSALHQLQFDDRVAWGDGVARSSAGGSRSSFSDRRPRISASHWMSVSSGSAAVALASAEDTALEWACEMTSSEHHVMMPRTLGELSVVQRHSEECEAIKAASGSAAGAMQGRGERTEEEEEADIHATEVSQEEETGSGSGVAARHGERAADENAVGSSSHISQALPSMPRARSTMSFDPWACDGDDSDSD